jgi:hypothetical protein
VLLFIFTFSKFSALSFTTRLIWGGTLYNYSKLICDTILIQFLINKHSEMVVNDRAENLLKVKINNNTTLPSFHNASYFMLGQ